ncbi:WD40 repeat domain-containing protein [Nocardioides sp. B-3]|uniref:WD40 repeat domain-containing protein n=1 Tax=Nocardioides sp. B-3 TaxID=2895565 RepID=UPI002153A09D|nr:WD40 repeat domain-containing protein [Nocardioides sp. B-3]UUZ57962.1 WD40 repeat domain-containing protein [Nocardioides sp. B-3]
MVLDDSPETIGNLQQAILRNPALIRSTPLSGTQTVALDVLPDGRTAALYDSAHTVSIRDLTTGAELARRQIGSTRSEFDTRRALRASPDGRMVAVGGSAFSAHLLHLLDARTLDPVSPQPAGLPPGNWRLNEAHFSQDSSTLAVVVGKLTSENNEWAPASHRAYVWSLGSSSKPLMIDLTPWTTGWASAVLSPDGRLLYTATPAVRVHDLRTGEVRTLLEQDTTPFEVGLDISPDGRFPVLARGDPEAEALLLDAGTGQVRHTLPHDNHTFDARFSSDGRRVLTATYRPTGAFVWDTRTGRRLAQFDLPRGEPGAVDLHGLGKRVISATDQSLRDLDVDGQHRYLRREQITGLPTWTGTKAPCFVNPSYDGAYIAYKLCTGHSIMVDVARRRAFRRQPDSEAYGRGGGSWFSPRAEYLRARGGTIYVMDGTTGRVRVGPHPVGNRVTELAHSPDGSRVVISELSGTLTLPDGPTLEPVGRQVDLGANVCCVALGPDNRTAFVLIGGSDARGFWDDPVDRWALVDLEAGEVVREGALGPASANWAVYSPTGRHVAATGFDGDVAIIDTETGQLVRQPGIAHGDYASWAAFSEDGSQLVSSGPDGTVILWEVSTGRITRRISVTEGVLTSPVFLPNGEILIVPWAGDPAVYVWDPSATRAVEFACRLAGRDLTEAEWAEHFPGREPRPVCPQD